MSPSGLVIRAKLGALGFALEHMRKVDGHQKAIADDHPSLYFRDVHVESLATNLQGLYTMAEALLKQVLDEVDGRLMKSETWHKDLLIQAHSSSDIRPSVISPRSFDVLDELLRFRHAVRSNYATSLRAENVFRLVEIAEAGLPEFISGVETFLVRMETEADPSADRPWTPTG